MPHISQFSAFFPPSPKFTDKNLPSLKGKVYIVTGGASGVGYELAKILYVAGGTVYIAARSIPRCEGAIEKIKSETGTSKGKNGQLKRMVVDLADMTTLKPAAEKFMREESRLDVLVHNAAVMTPPAGSKDTHGHDLEVGTNCLSPYLLTMLLEPIISRTATAPGTQPLSVRIVWVVSLLQGGTLPGAMKFDKNGTPAILEKPFMGNYLQSKAGAAWLADEFAKRLGSKGVLSISVHPGLMRTELQRSWGLFTRVAMSVVFRSPPVFGAYSELYAGFSPEIKAEHNGGHMMAWGRIAELPKDIIQGTKSKAEGGTGAKATFMKYCDREVKDFL
ncbi:hypothetical protein V495_04427 [Pseudogymnoascus sp. VKM F-4514 (FW-929)]|nr:hypothetical protein V490_06865 [Pseudogymnoascus sp. VKM F-3557]KFY42609.1 hypothetical protein V495_04427 [Pseudogymnoascus sp. VKM F-4514 (FW-929)]KFY51377.1 hypothetical protein V497_09189 [Pseudogymnoascus sp. VKM F-4516 (FW-969)]